MCEVRCQRTLATLIKVLVLVDLEGEEQTAAVLVGGECRLLNSVIELTLS